MSSAPFLLALLFASPSIEISVGAGGTSNAFQMPSDSAVANTDRPQPGFFVPVQASGKVKSKPGRLFRAGARGRFESEFFPAVRQDPAADDPTSASDANTWSGFLAVPLTVDPVPEKRSGLRPDFTLEPFARGFRSTYTSHRTGRPLIIDGTDLRNRYSNNKFGVKADADLAIGRTFKVAVGGRYTRADYLDDYRSSPEFASWDYGEIRFDLDGYARPGAWYLSAAYARRLRDYDERFPRDAGGNKVSADRSDFEPQRFLFHDVVLRAGRIGDRGRAVLRYGFTRRIDEFAGYLDYLEHEVSADLRLRVGEAAELRVEPSYGVRDYDLARVNFDPAAPETNRRRASLESSFEWPLRTRTRGFVQLEGVDQSSSNPLFTYRAFRAITGLRVMLR